MLENTLESLKKYTDVAADTYDFKSVAIYKPKDITLDINSIHKAITNSANKNILEEALRAVKKDLSPIPAKAEKAYEIFIALLVGEIIKNIPGNIFIPIDIRNSFSEKGMIFSAIDLLKIMDNYKIPHDRIFLRFPGTWEGMKATEFFKSHYKDIQVDVYMVYNLVQAVAAGTSRADTVSATVGSLFTSSDGSQASQASQASQTTQTTKTTQTTQTTQTSEVPLCTGTQNILPEVENVKKMFAYFKKFGIKSKIIASKIEHLLQIIGLCGIDEASLTAELMNTLLITIGSLSPFALEYAGIDKLNIDEKEFRWLMNVDIRASNKLRSSIQSSFNDINAALDYIANKLK